MSSSVLPSNLGEDFPASCIGWKIFQAFPLLICAIGTEVFQMPAHKPPYQESERQVRRQICLNLEKTHFVMMD